MLYFTHLPRSPQWMDFYQIWYRRSPRGRNRLCWFFCRSVQGYWFCGGLKFAYPHRNWRSPLTLSELPFRLWYLWWFVLSVASSPIDLSATTTPCRENHCTNFASSFIYPYCYQHIDQKIVENTLTQRQPQQMMSAPPGQSFQQSWCSSTKLNCLAFCLELEHFVRMIARLLSKFLGRCGQFVQ